MKIFNWLFGKKQKVKEIDLQSYEQKKLALDRELFEYEKELQDKIARLADDYTESLKYQLERKQRLELSIVKLDAEDDIKRTRYETCYNDFNAQLNTKDQEIRRLNNIIEELISHFPKVEVLNKVAA